MLPGDLGKVVGVDLSLTGTGLGAVVGGVCLPPETVRVLRPGRVTVESQVARINRVVAAVMGWCGGASLAVVEGPSMRSVGGSPHERGGLWWAVAARLVAADIPVAVIPPATLKKWAAGSGKATKAAMLDALRASDPWLDVRDDNQADATWLAKAGVAWLTDGHDGLLDKAEWPEG